MSNTVAGRRQFENSQECIAKKRQWRRHANENTPEQNASIERASVSIPPLLLFQSFGIFVLSTTPQFTRLYVYMSTWL